MASLPRRARPGGRATRSKHAAEYSLPTTPRWTRSRGRGRQLRRRRLLTRGPGLPAFLVDETNGSWGKAIGVPGRPSTGGDAEVDSVSCATAGTAPPAATTATAPATASLRGRRDERQWGTAIEVPGMARLNSGGTPCGLGLVCDGRQLRRRRLRPRPPAHRAFVVGRDERHLGHRDRSTGDRAPQAGGTPGVTRSRVPRPATAPPAATTQRPRPRRRSSSTRRTALGNAIEVLGTARSTGGHAG